MSFTIASIQNSKLRTLATTVDSTFNGKTKNNKIIDDCEIPIFEAQVKAKGLGNEYFNSSELVKNSLVVIFISFFLHKFLIYCTTLTAKS